MRQRLVFTFNCVYAAYLLGAAPLVLVHRLPLLVLVVGVAVLVLIIAGDWLWLQGRERQRRLLRDGEQARAAVLRRGS